MNRRKTVTTAVCIALWLLIWFIAAYFIHNDLFLPSPVSVIKELWSLMHTGDFYKSILYSLRGIGAGFLTGLLSGILLAALSYRFSFAESFISVPVKVIKAVPVASFVILSLLLLKASALSTLISALMVMPMIYSGVLSALKNTDIRMLEFAKVYRLSAWKKTVYIYIPAVMSPLTASASVAIGFAWKSGVAAETIGLIRNSIGNELYKTKLYLETPALFAWTLAIVIISALCELLIKYILKLVSAVLGGGRSEHGN